MNVRTRISFTPVAGAEKYGIKYRTGPIGDNGQPALGDEVVVEFTADDLAHRPSHGRNDFFFVDIIAPAGNFTAMAVSGFANGVWGKAKAYNFIANPAGAVLPSPDRVWMYAVAIESEAPKLKIAGNDDTPAAPPAAEALATAQDVPTPAGV